MITGRQKSNPYFCLNFTLTGYYYYYYKGKAVPVLVLTEHYAKKVYWGSGGITPFIL